MDFAISAAEYGAAMLALPPVDRERLTARFGGEAGQATRIEMNIRDPDLADVCEQLFGDRNVTPARERVYNAMCQMGSVEQAGWDGPRREANNGVDTLDTTKDYHVWLEDLENNEAVVDYPNSQLARGSEYWTNNIVRHEWSNELADAIQPRLEREARIWIQRLTQTYGSKDKVMEAIMENRFPVDHCLPRAFLIHESNPTRYRIVIGALGFIQADGRTFWEHG